MHKQITLLFLFFLTSIWGQIPAGYYDSAQGLTGNDLKTALHSIISGHQTLTYSQVWDALRFTDEDPNNTSNVILLYTGWSYPKSNNGGSADNWNREHTWAKSHGGFGNNPPAGTDIHHLRPTDVSVNSKRGNKHFDNGGTLYYDPTRFGYSGSYPTGCKYTSDTWEPRDEVKGDVARMIFYMAVRYDGDNGEPDLEVVDYIPNNTSDPLHGVLSTLLQWHQQDPVSTWEIRRNNRIYYGEGSNHDYAQWNRNPFIDHPEFVNRIWGTQSIDDFFNSPVSVYPNPTTTGQIHIKYKYNTKLPVNFYLNSLSGQEINIQPKIQSDEIFINNLPKGIFILKIVDTKTTFYQKIIVQ